jgi:predicted TIM-barrel fold metal-dependent hydrolase
VVPLIDTHQHLIHPDRLGYAWAREAPELAGRAFPLEAYQELVAGKGIAGTIFMEVDVDEGQAAAEARLVAEIARRPGSGILGLIAACRPEYEAGFEEWLDEAPALGVVGYRRVLHVVPDGVSQSETFRANIRKVGARGLAFDMVFLARQLGLACELARACPETVLVLDHCGVPDIAGGSFGPWRDGIRALAALPNIHAKISGVMAYCAPGGATLAAVRPYIEHVIDCFGPERCLWGSDWPVVDLRADLPTWIAAWREIEHGLSVDEAAAIGHRTASRVYRVTLPEPT